MSYEGAPYYPPEYDYPAIDFEAAPHVQKARLLHKCSVCSQAIKPGQVYTKLFAVIEGSPSTLKFHGVVQGECLGPEGSG